MLSEKVTGLMLGLNRPILIPSVPVSEGIDFDMAVNSSVVWSLTELPGGLGRFLPCWWAFICPD